MRTSEQRLQAYLDNGPHAGQTLDVDAEDDGSPPEHLEMSGPDTPSTYHVHRHDAERGVWVYRAGPDPDGRAGSAGADVVADRYDAEHWQAQMEIANDSG
jgi:hypothetical protein